MGFLGSLAVLSISTIVIPYTTAFICNLLALCPFTLHNLLKALQPRQVYLVNRALMREIMKLRFIPILFKWKNFYRSAPTSRVVKDIPFGSDSKHLDVYFPCLEKDESCDLPVVIYIFGGAYSSGDKNMYGLLCSNLADRLNALVICPNYSIFPQGYMDDMINDVVESIIWVHDNIEQFRGLKNQIMLVGFSCGAHLCVMALLQILGGLPRKNDCITTENHAFISLTSEKKAACNEQQMKSDTDYTICNDSKCFSDEQNESDNVDTMYIKRMEPDKEPLMVSSNCLQDCLSTDEKTELEYTEDSINHALVRDKSTLSELSSSIKGFVGLSGVYDIGRHYEYEITRGLEKLSCMTRAARGLENFERCSPFHLLESFTYPNRLPVITLVHGTSDIVVPYQGTNDFAQELATKFSNVSLHLIDSCDHPQACVDLMDKTYPFYEKLMDIIDSTHCASLV